MSALIWISGTTSKAGEAHASVMQSHAVFPQWSGKRLGFRLTRDDSGRWCRGGGWVDGRAALRVINVPEACGDFLGFRLCVDWREG